MYMCKIYGAEVVLRYLLLFLIFVLPFGCSTASKPNPTLAGSQPLPSYESGTTYVYSNGSWETVTAISAPLVTWIDHRGNVYKRSPDFTRRSTSWETSTKSGSRRFVPRSDSLVRKSTSLWPLQVGNEASFTEEVISRKIGEPEKSYRVNWTCEVIGTERVAVMAGEFDTWKIACNRYNNSRNPRTVKVIETRTWNYAPIIKHYVLTERKYSGGKPARRLELVAVLPSQEGISELAKSQMDTAFQVALEDKKRGETVTWSTPNTSWSGGITPTKTFRLADGRYSRRYIQKVNYPGGKRTYFGLAVRDSNGVWITPRR